MFYEIVLATTIVIIFDFNTFKLIKRSLTKMFTCFCRKKPPLVCAKCKKVLKKDCDAHVTSRTDAGFVIWRQMEAFPTIR